MINRLTTKILAGIALWALVGCTANVENPTVDQTGKSTDQACVTKCDDSNTTCVAKCNDDTCKASCKTDLDDCSSSCTTTKTSSGGSGS
ncbi:MAG: hypothetical protein ABJB12_01910 [Pseudomonadota bacterium]